MTENQRRNWYKFCSEPLDKIEHYEEALAEDFAGWCIHHRLEIQESKRVSMQELKSNGLYYGRPASELIFMRRPEHNRLHLIGNTYTKGKHHSEESRCKMSEAAKGKHHSEESRKKNSLAHIGKRHSTETRKKMSESRKGMHKSAETRHKLSEAHKGKTLSAEHRNKLSEAKKGKHWWNNGISSTLAKECPGPEWKPGRIFKP